MIEHIYFDFTISDRKLPVIPVIIYYKQGFAYRKLSHTIGDKPRLFRISFYEYCIAINNRAYYILITPRYWKMVSQTNIHIDI